MTEREQQDDAKQEPKSRKPYTTPRLERLGTVQDLTRGGGGKKNDPTNTPKTNTRS